MRERRAARRTVYRGRILDVHVDDVVLPNGRAGVREVVAHRGAVVLVPLMGADVLMVRQYRYAVGAHTVELPAGTLEPGEDPTRAAQRELAEETGYTAGAMVPLADVWPTPGYCTERMHLYIARDLTPGDAAPDDDEFLELVQTPLEDAVADATAGRLRDMKTVTGLLLAAARLEDRLLG